MTHIVISVPVGTLFLLLQRSSALWALRIDSELGHHYSPQIAKKALKNYGADPPEVDLHQEI